MTDAEKLAQAVILMCRPPKPWTPEDHKTWRECTGTPLVTMGNLVNLARRIIDNERSTKTSGLAGQVHADGAVIGSPTETRGAAGPRLAHISPVPEQKQSVE